MLLLGECSQSSDFLDANRPVLPHGAAGGQADCESLARIEHAARTFGARSDGVQEAVDLGPIGGRETNDEILIARLAWWLDAGLQRAQWGARIPSDRNAVVQPEHLHADVITARIVSHRCECAEGAAFELQRRAGRVDV